MKFLGRFSGSCMGRGGGTPRKPSLPQAKGETIRNWSGGGIPGKSVSMGLRGGGKLGSRRQVWESYRPREELGDRVSVSGGPPDGGELGEEFGFLGRKIECLGPPR